MENITVRDLQRVFFGPVVISRLVRHDDGPEYVQVYSGSMSELIDSDHKSILNSEIICAIVSASAKLPFLDITVQS